jgi:GNAT superfamily N-acetyltransferase
MNADALYAAINVTWPSETVTTDGPWVHREAVGAGNRLNATTLELTSGGVPNNIPDRPLFMVRGDQSALDIALEKRGYAIKDPVTAYVINVDKIAQASGPTRVFTAWPELAVMAEVWATGGIGPERIASMERVKTAKTGFLCRANDRAAGVAFAAISGELAMLHGLEVLPQARRTNVATDILRQAAYWADQNGAHQLAVLVTTANTVANAVYQNMGFMKAVGYHYRIRGPL